METETHAEETDSPVEEIEEVVLRMPDVPTSTFSTFLFPSFFSSCAMQKSTGDSKINRQHPEVHDDNSELEEQ